MSRWQYQGKVDPLVGSLTNLGANADAAAPSDTGTLVNKALLQYQSFVGPVIVPATAAYDPSAGTGAAYYPAWIYRPQFHASRQQNWAWNPSTWVVIRPDYWQQSTEPQRRAVNPALYRQALAWNTDTPVVSFTGPFNFQQFPPFAQKSTLHSAYRPTLAWNTVVPPDASRIPLTQAHGPYFPRMGVRPGSTLAWNTDTPASAVLTALSWKPTYADAIRFNRIHASRQPFYAWSSYTPALTPNGGTLDGGVLSNRSLIQYQSISAPVFVATPPVVFTGPFNFPQLPDQAILEVGLRAQYAPFYAAGPIEQMTMEWLPKHPDRIWKRGRRAQYAPYFGGFGITEVAASNTDAATKPVYPNVIFSKAPTWRLFEASPNPAVEIARAAQAGNVASWRGWQPDFIARKTMLPAQMQSLADVSVSIFPVLSSGWDPEFPAFIPRQRMLAAWQQVLAQPFSEQGASAPDYWFPTFDAQVYRRSYHPSFNRADAWVRFIDPVPDLSWKSIYPDAINRLALHPAFQPRGIDMWTPTFAVTPVALTNYPDWIFRSRFNAAWQQAWVTGTENGQPAPDHSWAPTFVDRIFRPTLHVSQMPAVFKDLQTFDVTPLAWTPRYPSFVQRNSMLAAQQLAFVLGSFGTISIPTLAWLPTFTDRHSYQIPRYSGSILNEFPIPNPVLVDLSWQPFFDAQTRSRIVHPSRVPAAWWHTITPAELPRGWDMQHQFPVRRVLRPIGGMVSGFDTTVSWTLGWKGTQPDRISRRALAEHPALFQPELSVFPAIAQYGWQAHYPVQHRRLRPPVWFTLPFAVEPSIIASRYDCIEIDDQDVIYSTLTNGSLTVSDITSETVTPTIEGDFC